MSTTIYQDKELQRELTKKVFSSNNDFLIHYYYNNTDKFINEIREMSNKLADLSAAEIELIRFVNELPVDIKYLKSI